MAYMYADSGNLMAVAQQVIKQKQEQQRKQKQQLEEEEEEEEVMAFSIIPHSTFAYSDPFQSDFPPYYLDSSPDFRFSEFDSDDWMETFIASTVPTQTSHPDFTFHASDPTRLVFSDAPTTLLPTLKTSPLSSPQNLHTTNHSLLLPSSNKEVDFFYLIMDCARIVESDPDRAAKSLLCLRDSVSELGDPSERVAFHFSQALYNRVLRKTTDWGSSSSEDHTLTYTTAINDACPYFKFVHLTANQAILEATVKATKIHIVDFGIVEGLQWAALLQALATRSDGKPISIRISGIPAPSLGTNSSSSLLATGSRLREFAELMGLSFEFDPILTPIWEMNVSSFRIENDEVVAVNFMLQLHKLLDETGEGVRSAVRLAKLLKPKVVTLGEHEACLNQGSFLERLGKALRYYAAVFESLECDELQRESPERLRFERAVLGHGISGIIGAENVRMQGIEEWRSVMGSCGLELVGVSHYAMSQARILLWNFSKLYCVNEFEPGFLSLAWNDMPLLTVSSWR